jgi:hypothetical protein
LSPEQKALEDAKLKTEKVRPGLIGAQTGAANAQARAATARADRLKKLASTIPQGSAAYKEFVTQGGDPEDRDEFLNYLKQRGAAGRKPSVAEILGIAPGALQQGANAPSGGGAPAPAAPKTLEDYKKLKAGAIR